MNYTIHDFMTEQLQLSGTELLLYALVYNFSQDGNGCFYGSNDYAAKKIGCRRECVNRNANSLVDKGLLSRTHGSHGGKPTIDYVAIVPDCAIQTQCAKNAQQVCENRTATCDEIAHNNQSDNLNDNQTSVVNNARAKEAKIQIAEFVSMTQTEYQKLIDEFGSDDANALVDMLNNYKGSSGKKYKSDYLAIRSWCVDRLEEQKRKARFAYQQQPTSGPRVNERGETPTVASMRAAAESFGRIAARHAAAPAGVDVIPAPIDEQDQIDD